MSGGAPLAARVGPAERALLAAVGAVLLALIAVATVWLPSFAAMYRDFGGELPRFTRLVMARWWPLAVGVPVLGGAAFALAVRRSRTLRVGLLAGLVTLAAAAVAATVVGAYLPLYQLAGNIRAD